MLRSAAAPDKRKELNDEATTTWQITTALRRCRSRTALTDPPNQPAKGQRCSLVLGLGALCGLA
jgi:hypothetical protein